MKKHHFLTLFLGPLYPRPLKKIGLFLNKSSLFDQKSCFFAIFREKLEILSIKNPVFWVFFSTFLELFGK
jgi:hypothetical protein